MTLKALNNSIRHFSFWLTLLVTLTSNCLGLMAQAQTSPPSAEASASRLEPVMEITKFNDEGVKAYKDNRYDEAERLFKLGVDLAQSQRSKTWMSTLLNNLAMVYDAQGKASDAEIARREADALKDQINGVTSTKVTQSPNKPKPAPEPEPQLTGRAEENVYGAKISQKDSPLKPRAPMSDNSSAAPAARLSPVRRAAIDQTAFAPLPPLPDLNKSLFEPLGKPAKFDLLPPEKTASSVASAPPEPVETAPKKLKRTIPISQYRALMGSEIAFEKLLRANNLLEQGADVTLLLDREGVLLANRHSTDAFQINRNSTEAQIPIQKLLADFMESGGTVLASDRWLKTFGLDDSEIRLGIQKLSDEEINAYLLQHAGEMMDY